MRLVAALVVVAGLLSLALAGAAQAATPSLSNSGFEKKTLTGWNVTGTTSTSIVKATNSYGAYTPAYGGYMAWVSAYGCNGNSGLPGTQPETLSQTFSATAGDTLSGKAYFKANDALPRNDSRAVRMVGPDGNVTTLLSWDVESVGTNGGSSWTPWAFTFPTTGTYTLKAVSINGVSTSGGSCTNPSVVGLDLPDPLDYLTPIAMLQQQIVVSPPTGVTYGDSPFVLKASAPSGLPLSYASSTPLVCSVDPSTGTVSIVAAGQCSILASQAGDQTYLPTSMEGIPLGRCRRAR